MHKHNIVYTDCQCDYIYNVCVPFLKHIKEHKFPRTRIRTVVEIMRLFFVCMAGDLKFYHVLFFKLIVLARMICNPEYKL